MKVSVIVCVRNGEQTLRAQLEALGRQRDAPPFEVVIVDNGSTDGTREVVSDWVAAGIGAAGDAFVVEAFDRPGVCHARNVGAASSEGEILAYCDADDVVGPNWTSALADAVDRGASVVTGPIREMNADGSPGGARIHGPDSLPFEAGATLSYPFFWGCNFAMKREIFERIGGFDAGMPPYGSDDSEIGVRLGRAGVGIHVASEMTIAYRVAIGWPARLRRQYRAGIARPVQWARHPEHYPHPPSRARLAVALVISPIGRLVTGRGRLRTRLLGAAEECARVAGTIAGAARLLRGAYAAAEFYEPLLDRRPRVTP